MLRNEPKLLAQTNEVFYEWVPIYKYRSSRERYQLGESELISREDLRHRLSRLIEEHKFDENKIRNVRGKINEGEPLYLLFDEADRAYFGIFFLTPQQKESMLHNYTYYIVDLSEKIAAKNHGQDLILDVATYLKFEKIKNKLQFFFKTWEKYIDMVIDKESELLSRKYFFEMKELWVSTIAAA